MTIQDFSKPAKRAPARPRSTKRNKAHEGKVRQHESAAEMLLRIGLAANDLNLPTDLSRNHDHYLYGVPKKK